MNIPQPETDLPHLKWICPNCKQLLCLTSRTWKCLNNHSFDVAKSGYVNLLLANQKASKLPGDDAAMLQARQGFLREQHFSPIPQKLIELIRAHLQNKQTAHILDTGCGEGYYLNQINNALPALVMGGVDIAKAGLQIAAKSNRSINWVCASNMNLPIADASIDILMRIFAPSNDAELGRIIQPEGMLLIVAPGSHHLFELKQQLYPKPTLHEDIASPAGFALTNRIELRWTMSLESQTSIENLLHMTPFYWRGPLESKQKLLQQSALEVTAHTVIYQFKPIASPQPYS